MGNQANQLSCLVFYLLAACHTFAQRTLQSDPSCGLSTRGSEECWWSCNIVPASGLVIKNPECFRNCFSPNHCVTGLLQDFDEAGGICPNSFGDKRFPGLFNVSRTVSCRLTEGKIDKGICSSETEKKLRRKRACLYSVFSLPEFIFNTVRRLIRDTCSSRVFKKWFEFQKEILDSKARLNPALNVINVDEVNFKTELNYENTRHRYPWLCSLRTRDGDQSRHLCAVTLLSRPPGPTILVSAAHCTYLCSSNGRTVPNCCCPNVGQVAQLFSVLTNISS